MGVCVCVYLICNHLSETCIDHFCVPQIWMFCIQYYSFPSMGNANTSSSSWLWVGEGFFWLTQVVLYKGPLNGCVYVCRNFFHLWALWMHLSLFVKWWIRTKYLVTRKTRLCDSIYARVMLVERVEPWNCIPDVCASLLLKSQNILFIFCNSALLMFSVWWKKNFFLTACLCKSPATFALIHYYCVVMLG